MKGNCRRRRVLNTFKVYFDRPRKIAIDFSKNRPEKTQDRGISSSLSHNVIETFTHRNSQENKIQRTQNT